MYVYVLKNIEAYFLIYEKAKLNGKTPGQSMQEEFNEVAKEHPEMFELLGQAEDVDMLAGELREQGVKVLNLKEIERQSKEQSDNSDI